MQAKDSLITPQSTRRLETWNIRNMFAIGKTAQIVREMQIQYHLDILRILVSECR